jgi:hypothetical protein
LQHEFPVSATDAPRFVVRSTMRRYGLDMLRRQCRITRLREHGYLYVYVFDAQNAWDYEHHATISAWKRFRGARLLALEPMLRARLAEYEPPLGRFVMPYETGQLVFEGVSGGER